MPKLIKTHSDKFGIILIAVTIIAGFAGVFLGADWDPKFDGSLSVFFLLGGLQFFLNTFGFAWIQERENRIVYFAYFVIATLNLGVILYLADFSTTWIVALPLAGQALSLSLPGAIIAISANFIVQMGIIWLITESFINSLQSASSLGVAMLFVVLFTYVTMQTEEKNEEILTLATKLQSANQQLREYATKAEELAITKERNRMAREIHDSLGHYLTVVNVQLEAARATLDVDPERAQAAIGKAQQLTREGLTDVRRSVASLRESPLENRPVPQALAELIAEAEATGISANLIIAGNPRPLPPNTALTLYRATQEALTNVRKHARASKVDIALEYAPDETIALTVSDNGIGSDATDGGFGLLGIKERVQLLRGQFNITTATGEGFRLEMSMPG